jgi:hypothetical protein
MVSPRLRRQAVVVMRSEVAVSERRACGLMELDRGTYRYRSLRTDDRRTRNIALALKSQVGFVTVWFEASCPTLVLEKLAADCAANSAGVWYCKLLCGRWWL